MQIDTVTTSDRSLLASVRETLADAEEALLCVAFVHSRSVHLIEDDLRDLVRRGRSRMVVTTTFDHDGGSALAVAADCGVAVRTLNPGSGSTYHPKVYLGRGRSRVNGVRPSLPTLRGKSSQSFDIRTVISSMQTHYVTM